MQVRPAARRALERQRAVERRDAVAEAAQARAGVGVRAADPVVGDVDGHASVDPAHRHRRPASPGRTWRRSRAPRRRRSRRRSPPRRGGAPGRRPPPSPAPAPVTRAPAAPARGRGRSGPPGGCRGPARAARRGSCRARRSPRSSSGSTSSSPAARRRAELSSELERHQARLGAVVQVALQAPALGVAGLHDPRARGAQLLQATAQLGIEQGQMACAAGRRGRRTASGGSR